MPAYSSVVTNLPGADLNSSAGPKGGGQDARNKVRQDTPYRRLATNGGEKCGLETVSTQGGDPLLQIFKMNVGSGDRIVGNQFDAI